MSRGYPRKQQAAFGCWSAPFSCRNNDKSTLTGNTDAVLRRRGNRFLTASMAWRTAVQRQTHRTDGRDE
ncbi:MAG TPA: hypothetical protein PKN04_04860 [bacterium]|nr:hypothetical protein [bacterium]HNT65091.1 hypothetical protein [bacterium]HOX84498.1 hypothetical protein [bacterium]HPG45905.1 hypothetical protein [bacterium]HPM97727.1 hypothetical protein [bacterium]